MFKFILLLSVLLFASSTLVQLDKQLKTVSDLTAYSFKALINNKIHNFNLQQYRSIGGYIT